MFTITLPKIENHIYQEWKSGPTLDTIDLNPLLQKEWSDKIAAMLFYQDQAINKGGDPVVWMALLRDLKPARPFQIRMGLATLTLTQEPASPPPAHLKIWVPTEWRLEIRLHPLRKYHWRLFAPLTSFQASVRSANSLEYGDGLPVEPTIRRERDNWEPRWRNEVRTEESARPT